jgi:hypothetical protein
MAIAKPNIMVGMSFSLLGTELLGAIQVTTEGQRIFIDQDVDAPGDGVPITRLVEDVKVLLGKSDDIPQLGGDAIKQQIQDLYPQGKKPTFDPSAVTISLQTVYFDINKPTGGDTTANYAFRVKVKLDGLLPPIDSIKLHYLTLSIWNTEKPEIRKRLGLPPANT